MRTCQELCTGFVLSCVFCDLVESVLPISGFLFTKETPSYCNRDSNYKPETSSNLLRFIMGIPIPVRRHLFSGESPLVTSLALGQLPVHHSHVNHMIVPVPVKEPWRMWANKLYDHPPRTTNYLNQKPGKIKQNHVHILWDTLVAVQFFLMLNLWMSAISWMVDMMGSLHRNVLVLVYYRRYLSTQLFTSGSFEGNIKWYWHFQHSIHPWMDEWMEHWYYVDN